MDMLETSSSHSKSAIADRLNRVVRNVNYKERGSAGFHTDSLEFANSSERDRWVEEHRAPNEAVARGWGYNIDIANYGDKDPATWIGPVIKRGAPIVRLITHGHARGMQFNANALRAESLENMRLGSKVLAKKKPAEEIFGEGSPSEQKDGWYQVYVGLDCAYQRCWQESQHRGQEAWTVLGRIPNTVDHNQHVFCEYRQGHVLPIMLARWPNQIMNMPFDNNVATEFYNLVTDEEFSFSGKSYASDGADESRAEGRGKGGRGHVQDVWRGNQLRRTKHWELHHGRVHGAQPDRHPVLPGPAVWDELVGVLLEVQRNESGQRHAPLDATVVVLPDPHAQGESNPRKGGRRPH